MNRKRWNQKHGPTNACTLRCLEASGRAQKERRPEEREPRSCGGDAWFAGARTTRACDDELGIKFVGPVKTNTKEFPRDAIRHTLHGTTRGTHVVFEEQDPEGEKTGTCAVGWSDHWCKAFVTNYGSVTPGKPANKKRQRAEDGRNYHVPAPRPSHLEHCYEISGCVDRHTHTCISHRRFQPPWAPALRKCRTLARSTDMQFTVFYFS